VVQELVAVVPHELRAVVLTDPSAPLPSVRDQPHAAPAKDNSQESQQLKEEHEALRRILTQLTDIAGELQAQQRQRLEEMQQVAVELALAVASRLLHERLEAGDCGVDLLVRQAVEQLKTTQPVTVFLHPQDVELLAKRLGTAPVLDPSQLRLVADKALKRGDCRAEAGDIGVRCHVEEQLAAIRRHLLETLPDTTLDRRRPLPADRPLRRFPERRHTA
jgi:flagellar biosynthesis/type III secretory pathway protein FliH